MNVWTQKISKWLFIICYQIQYVGCKWWTQINIVLPFRYGKSTRVWNLSLCHEIPCILISSLISSDPADISGVFVIAKWPILAAFGLFLAAGGSLLNLRLFSSVWLSWRLFVSFRSFVEWVIWNKNRIKKSKFKKRRKLCLAAKKGIIF